MLDSAGSTGGMTEEQLVQAVLDFPFWIELFVYSHVKTGVKSMEKNCDAYAELLRRGTAKEALLTKAAQLQKRPVTTAEEEIENEMITSLIYVNSKPNKIVKVARK